MPTVLLTRERIMGMSHSEMPFLVLTDNCYSWFSWRIKGHTDGYYNHAAMLLWDSPSPTLVSQNWVLQKEPIAQYLKGKHRIKFWRNPTWSWKQMAAMEREARSLLALPTYRRLYDIVGLFGQLIRRPSLNIPSLFYCSEAAARILAAGGEDCGMKHPTPADLNRWCKASPNMECWGIYDPDIEEQKGD